MKGREAALFWNNPTGLLRKLVEMVIAEARAEEVVTLRPGVPTPTGVQETDGYI